MADEQAPEVTPKRKSVLPKLLGLAAVMLVVAVVINLKDIRAIASGQRTVKSVFYGKSFLPMKPTFAFPEPRGPENARVKVQVVCQQGNSCHAPLVVLWMAVSQVEPERVRVEFSSGVGTPQEGKQPVQIGCDAGVVINGDMKFELGKGKEKRVLYLTGPTPAPGPAEGMPKGAPGISPGGHGWNFADVAAVVNQYIEKQYKQRGKLTAAAINAAIPEAEKLIPRPDDTTDKLGQSGEPKASSH